MVCGPLNENREGLFPIYVLLCQTFERTYLEMSSVNRFNTVWKPDLAESFHDLRRTKSYWLMHRTPSLDWCIDHSCPCPPPFLWLLYLLCLAQVNCFAEQQHFHGVTDLRNGHRYSWYPNAKLRHLTIAGHVCEPPNGHGHSFAGGIGCLLTFLSNCWCKGLYQVVPGSLCHPEGLKLSLIIPFTKHKIAPPIMALWVDPKAPWNTGAT